MSSCLVISYNNNIYRQRAIEKKLSVVDNNRPNDFYKVFNIIKSKFKFDINDAIIVLFSGYTNLETKSINNFIKSNPINKIYFFIEDVFRITCSEDTYASALDTYTIEKFPQSTESIELNVVQQIMRKTNVDYEIYHCEYNCNFFSKKYNKQIKYFDTFSSFIINENKEKTKINYSFEHYISCFNLRDEMHRFIISILLQDEPHTRITCNFKYNQDRLTDNRSLPLDNFSIDLKNKILNSYEKINYDKLLWDLEFVKDTVPDISGVHQWKNLSEIKNSFVNVVTETRFSSPMPCFNEKTLKPILVYRPFILLAPPGTLSLLKNLGIKTFDNWWDESYDSISDHNLRFEKVYNLCIDILSKPKEDLEKILVDMSDILLHNRNILESVPDKMLLLN